MPFLYLRKRSIFLNFFFASSIISFIKYIFSVPLFILEPFCSSLIIVSSSNISDFFFYYSTIYIADCVCYRYWSVFFFSSLSFFPPLNTNFVFTSFHPIGGTSLSISLNNSYIPFKIFSPPL